MTGEAWLDTVRLARDFGDVSQLLPDGINHFTDLPHTIFDAIRAAAIILSFEELPQDEQPPRRIWLDGDKLAAFMDDVRAKRRRDLGGNDIEDPVDNQAAADLLAGLR